MAFVHQQNLIVTQIQTLHLRLQEANVNISVSYISCIRNFRHAQWCFQFNANNAALNCLVELNQKLLVTEYVICTNTNKENNPRLLTWNNKKPDISNSRNDTYIITHLQYNLTAHLFRFVQTQFDLPFSYWLWKNIFGFTSIYGNTRHMKQHFKAKKRRKKIEIT